MKKIIAILLGVLAFAAVASAQPRALGLRGGPGGVELSYQHGFGSNFAEFDLGASFARYGTGIALQGFYDFVVANAGVVNFSVGPGAMLGVYGYNDGTTSTSVFTGGVGAQFGIEFELPSIPLNISLDWAPLYIFNGGMAWGNAAVGLRYRF